MKYILLLFLIAVEAKLRIYLTDTPLQRIGARIYKKKLLTDQFKSPKELTYDSSSRNLFFMYMDDVIQNSGRAVINVITKQAKKIHGIEKNKAIAVDPDTSDVYFGSEDGLYKYDPVTNEARNIGLYNVNIMKLVVRNNEMFLLDANNHMLYKVFNEGKTAVKLINMKTVMEFEIDDNRDVHFVTMCGVYCAINGHEIVKNTDLSVVYNFIVSDGRTYGVTEDGIYALDCANGTARMVADLDFIPRSMTFGDYGDIYYSEDDFIYKLSPISSYLVYNVHRNVK
ncbi:hypothetical protein O3G_MSEX011145 [Manduca sexta]|uniref:Ommochrome-binding protein n=1 Tax=Manduca sexta TaxID=7130 RepID=A0A921ZK96_MANSE|nr:hypothetical protein O3G_MSEX011145 [Manduca sexta]